MPGFGLVLPRSSAAGGTLGGTLGSTDNRLARSDGTGGATFQATGITVGDANEISGFIVNVIADNGGDILTQARSGSMTNIESGNGADTITLPAAPTIGTRYEFVIKSADELTIQAQGLHVVCVGVGSTILTSTAAGTLKSSTIGSMVVLTYAALNRWIGIATGTWAAD